MAQRLFGCLTTVVEERCSHRVTLLARRDNRGITCLYLTIDGEFQIAIEIATINHDIMSKNKMIQAIGILPL